MSHHDRQSFLGTNSEQIIKEITLGLVGLGGGGSHCLQQAAHLGFVNYLIIDPDVIEDTNLNRLVGGTQADVDDQNSKVNIAERVIYSIQPTANIEKCQSEWQTEGDKLKHCDVIIGGLDSATSKDQLESFCRRFMIPYIDMGMDVHQIKRGYLISGQVILSSPGTPCLRCLGIITEEDLRKEAQKYGEAGSRPQVVWSNGVLASSAIGLLMQLLTPWHKASVNSAYLEYDGNLNTIVESQKLQLLNGRTCPHYPLHEVGDPGFDIRKIALKKPASAIQIEKMQFNFIRWLNKFLKN